MHYRNVYNTHSGRNIFQEHTHAQHVSEHFINDFHIYNKTKCKTLEPTVTPNFLARVKYKKDHAWLGKLLRKLNLLSHHFRFILPNTIINKRATMNFVMGGGLVSSNNTTFDSRIINCNL